MGESTPPSTLKPNPVASLFSVTSSRDPSFCTFKDSTVDGIVIYCLVCGSNCIVPFGGVETGEVTGEINSKLVEFLFGVELADVLVTSLYLQAIIVTSSPGS